MEEQNYVEEMNTRSEILKEVSKKMEKLMQSGKLKKATEISKTTKLLSYVFAFDFLTQGGIPEGKFTLIYGDKSTGKSTFSLRLLKSFLMKYPDRLACYMDFEDTFDIDWAKTIVGDKDLLDRILIAKPQFAEEGIEIFNDLIDEYRNYEIGFYVIDSIASMVAVSEAESDADQNFVGLIARNANKFLRKLLTHSIGASRKDQKYVTVLLINQIRHGFSQGMRFSTETKPGGKFQEALASLEVKFFVDTIQKEKETGIPHAVEYKFVIEKNKTGGTPKVIGKYIMNILNTDEEKIGDVADGHMMIQFLKKLSLLVQEGSKWKITPLGLEFKTQKEIIEKISSDLSFKETLTLLLIKEGYNFMGHLISFK